MPDPMTPTPTDAAARIADAVKDAFTVEIWSIGDEWETATHDRVAKVVRTALAAECEGLAQLAVDWGWVDGSLREEFAALIRAHLCGPAK